MPQRLKRNAVALVALVSLAPIGAAEASGVFYPQGTQTTTDLSKILAPLNAQTDHGAAFNGLIAASPAIPCFEIPPAGVLATSVSLTPTVAGQCFQFDVGSEVFEMGSSTPASAGLLYATASPLTITGLTIDGNAAHNSNTTPLVYTLGAVTQTYINTTLGDTLGNCAQFNGEAHITIRNMVYSGCGTGAAFFAPNTANVARAVFDIDGLVGDRSAVSPSLISGANLQINGTSATYPTEIRARAITLREPINPTAVYQAFGARYAYGDFIDYSVHDGSLGISIGSPGGGYMAIGPGVVQGGNQWANEAPGNGHPRSNSATGAISGGNTLTLSAYCGFGSTGSPCTGGDQPAVGTGDVGAHIPLGLVITAVVHAWDGATGTYTVSCPGVAGCPAVSSEAMYIGGPGSSGLIWHDEVLDGMGTDGVIREPREISGGTAGSFNIWHGIQCRNFTDECADLYGDKTDTIFSDMSIDASMVTGAYGGDTYGMTLDAPVSSQGPERTLISRVNIYGGGNATVGLYTNNVTGVFGDYTASWINGPLIYLNANGFQTCGIDLKINDGGGNPTSNQWTTHFANGGSLCHTNQFGSSSFVPYAAGCTGYVRDASIGLIDVYCSDTPNNIGEKGAPGSTARDYTGALWIKTTALATTSGWQELYDGSGSLYAGGAVTLSGIPAIGSLGASVPVCRLTAASTLNTCGPNASSTTEGAVTGTASTSYVMAGLGQTFTPTKSGTILIFIGWNASTTAIGGGEQAQIAYGTVAGGIPSNGAASTGTTTGGTIAFTSATVANKSTQNAHSVITGLTVGTAYWFDLQFENNAAAATANITNPRVTIIEL